MDDLNNLVSTIFSAFDLSSIVVGADSKVGIWKLNPAKTKRPANLPKEYITYEIVTIETQDNGWQYTFDFVTADGKTFHKEFAPKFDPGDYPVKGDPQVDHARWTRIGANTVNLVWKKDGIVIEDSFIVVSECGKTATVTAKTKDSQGQDVTIVSFFDKW